MRTIKGEIKMEKRFDSKGMARLEVRLLSGFESCDEKIITQPRHKSVSVARKWKSH